MITKQEALAITTYDEFDKRRDEFEGFNWDKETTRYILSLFPEPSGCTEELYRTHPYEPRKSIFKNLTNLGRLK